MSVELDKFDRLRYIGYCWSKLPPGEIDFDDFVEYAKFQLCAHSGRLMKDPIWEEYTSEEILVEHYAQLFQNSEEQAERFLKKLKGEKETTQDSFADWADEQDDKEVVDKEGEEESISFTPDAIGED